MFQDEQKAFRAKTQRARAAKDAGRRFFAAFAVWRLGVKLFIFLAPSGGEGGIGDGRIEGKWVARPGGSSGRPPFRLADFQPRRCVWKIERQACEEIIPETWREAGPEVAIQGQKRANTKRC